MTVDRENKLSPGTRLGSRYELLTPWAKGGMAQVWLARVSGKHGFTKLYAVKTMLPERADEQEFRTMFLDEARIASQVRHVNVATIEDLGEDDGVMFMVFEWIQGDSLDQIVRAAKKAGHPLPVDVVLSIAAQTARGLHAAHELRDDAGQRLNVVHRDVSPQNILLSETGVAKIIDFGVAKAKNRLAEATMTGLVKGKLEFMAPEQAMSMPFDRRADIFAVGAVAYTALTGRLVWDAPNDAAMLFKISSGEPPPRATELPAKVADVLDRALHPDPEKRFQTAQELERALEASMSRPMSVDDLTAATQTFLQNTSNERRARIRTAVDEANAREAAQAPGASVRRPMTSIPPEAAPISAPQLSANQSSELHVPRSAPRVVWPAWLLPALVGVTLILLGVWARVFMLSWQMRHGTGGG